MEHPVANNETLLKAIAEIADIFLRLKRWESHIDEISRRIGMATNVSRVNVYKNVEDDSEICCSKLIHSYASASIDKMNDSGNKLCWSDNEELSSSLKNGEIFKGFASEYTDGKKREILESNNIKSFIITPVYSNNKCWGFIGYDECTYDRKWAKPVMDSLQIFATMLGSAINRYRLESMFEQKFMQSSMPTQIYDKHGVCVKINSASCKHLGINAGDVEGKYNMFTDSEVIKNGIDKILRTVYDEKKSVEWNVHFDVGNSAKSNNIETTEPNAIWLHNTAYPILDDNDEVINIVVQNLDITASKKLEIKFESIIQSIPEIIMVFDANRKRVELYPKSVQDIYPAMKNIPNGTISDARYAEHVSKLYSIFDKIDLDRNYTETVTMDIKTGRGIKIFETIVKAFNDTKYMTIARDVTDLRQLQSLMEFKNSIDKLSKSNERIMERLMEAKK